MSDTDPHAQDSKFDIVDVDVRAWVEAARANPTLYRDRQITEIVLGAIGLAPSLSKTLVLKGGAVMALAFKSNRVTGDVDFTSMAEPADLTEKITTELNVLLPQTAIKLGYLDLLCRVQSVKKMPRAKNFENYEFPALRVKIGSAKRGTGEEARLADGKAIRVLDIEISFRDQVYAFQELNLTGAGVAVRAFTIHELIAEKLRALLQQPGRNRNRRQDVYDIAFLIDEHDFNVTDKTAILTTLIEKCRSRGIAAQPDSMDNPEIKHRAQADWDMRLRSLSGPVIQVLAQADTKAFADRDARLAHLDGLDISQLHVAPDPVRIATEAAIWGSIKSHGLLSDLEIVSDGAGQFNIV